MCLLLTTKVCGSGRAEQTRLLRLTCFTRIVGGGRCVVSEERTCILLRLLRARSAKERLLSKQPG